MNVKRSLWMGILLMVAFGAPAAMADTVLGSDFVYSMSFTTLEFETAPTAGAFTYFQPIVATEAPFFKAFSVTWLGITFDLTNGANHPLIFGPLPNCITGSNAAATFELLTNCAADEALGASDMSPGQASWEGAISGGGAEFFFIDTNIEVAAAEVMAPAGSPSTTDFGEWTATRAAAPVPEPSLAILLSTGVLLCALVARWT